MIFKRSLICMICAYVSSARSTDSERATTPEGTRSTLLHVTAVPRVDKLFDHSNRRQSSFQSDSVPYLSSSADWTYNNGYIQRNSLGQDSSRSVDTSNGHTFGNRPFGSIARFQVDPQSGLTWVAYFYAETFAPVLQDKDKTMVDCTIIEVRKEWEQEAAMNFFGRLMELVPLSVPEMVHLITLCGILPSTQIYSPSARQLPINLNSVNNGGSTSDFQPRSSIILPGTLWCGMRDRASRYELLGERRDLDRCCRAHDHCPIKLGPFENRYGTSNFGFATRSHCLCDLEFYRCLKGNENELADAVGNFYFDVLRAECLQQKKPEVIEPEGNSYVSGRDINGQRNTEGFRGGYPTRYQCTALDSKRKCRYWKKQRQFFNDYRKEAFVLTY